MPKFVNFFNEDHLNVFDAIRLNEPAWRLFNNANVGVPHLSNMMVGGQLSVDLTFFVHNLYARTNVPASPAFQAWLESSTATFVVGNSPRFSRSLAEMIRIGPGEVIAPTDPEDPHGDMDLARQLELLASERERRPAGPVETWLPVAGDARRILKGPQVIVIPVRQSFHFRISCEPESTSAMRMALDPSIKPEPLVWIHIEGFTRSDVR